VAGDFDPQRQRERLLRRHPLHHPHHRVGQHREEHGRPHRIRRQRQHRDIVLSQRPVTERSEAGGTFIELESAGGGQEPANLLISWFTTTAHDQQIRPNQLILEGFSDVALLRRDRTDPRGHRTSLSCHCLEHRSRCVVHLSSLDVFPESSETVSYRHHYHSRWRSNCDPRDTGSSEQTNRPRINSPASRK
jgi:hypothetical protein